MTTSRRDTLKYMPSFTFGCTHERSRKTTSDLPSRLKSKLSFTEGYLSLYQDLSVCACLKDVERLHICTSFYLQINMFTVDARSVLFSSLLFIFNLWHPDILKSVQEGHSRARYLKVQRNKGFVLLLTSLAGWGGKSERKSPLQSTMISSRL